MPVVRAKRVLIVEADSETLHTLTRAVSAAGHEAVAFSGFEAAQAYLTDEMPDVLVSEVRLGAFNGLHLVMIAKRHWPGITAVVVTRFDDPVLRQEAARHGAAYVLKPLEITHLLATIDQAPAVRVM